MRYGASIVCVVLGGYVLSYTILSGQGMYVPVAFSNGRTEVYMWMPRGFFNSTDPAEPNSGRLQTFYRPLFRADLAFWHNHGLATRPGDRKDSLLDSLPASP